MKNLKLISVIVLSLMLIFSITTAVFAADENVEDDNFWSEPEVVDNNVTNEDNTAVNETSNELDNSTDNETENLFNDLEVENTENDTYNNLIETNSTTTNSNSLAETGIGDSNGIIALIVIISVIVAIYSAKKMNEYKNV